MGSMNSNNWLSFPLSPTNSSLATHLHSSQTHHQFNLGFSGSLEIRNSSLDLTAAFSEFHQSNDSDYSFQHNNIVQVPNTTLIPIRPPAEFQESANNLQSLTLSMCSGKGSTSETSAENSTNTVDAPPRRTLDTFGQRTSIYRGVTRHRWTGRYEAHLWDNSCRREGQSRKGRQGGYDKEDKAARAYDLATLKYWGTSTTTNFPISNYEKELEEMKHMTRQEFVASIRRHHQHGRWQARIGRVARNKDLYLGTFNTEEEAAEAYDIAAIKFRGLNAVTNFDMNRYDTLQNHDMNSQYASSFHQNYIQTQLQLHQQQSAGSYNLQHSRQSSQFYNSYIQSNPALLHGLVNMSCSSPSVVDNNGGGSSGTYSGGYLGTAGNTVGTTEELGLVKVNYDMPSGSYGGWSGDSVQGSNPGVFPMWND
ncbi:AP2-like ethylene-responsive transcription factor PLT2 [Hibiscus syriacus]|uniref:AP2-like ethylene-responsive transcription factor PLT2 n=1 Tax=Hibiscus syriacus TaxID=106335 RepID=A0A6A2XCV5_HIBSY|nr:AP2-like ethylene-responsive transcription factor PLT2 [Hibiscus syriacus]